MGRWLKKSLRLILRMGRGREAWKEMKGVWACASACGEERIVNVSQENGVDRQKWISCSYSYSLHFATYAEEATFTNDEAHCNTSSILVCPCVLETSFAMRLCSEGVLATKFSVGVSLFSVSGH